MWRVYMHLDSSMTLLWLVLCSYFAGGGHALQQSILAQRNASHSENFCHKGWCHGQNINNGEATWDVRSPRDVLPDYTGKEAYNTTLLPLKFEPLPLGSIRATGWLGQQMNLMADGLPGHMHEFYRQVKDSVWLGGSEEYSWLNEAWPYHYNALVPLAWTADNARLKHHVLHVTDWVIEHQQEDGWLGPEENVSRRNFWGRYPLFLGLMQLVEAEPKLGQTMILPAMHRFVGLMYTMLKDHHQGFVWKPGDLFDEQWGRARAADMVLALQWLYEKHPMDNKEIIHFCMTEMYEMAYDWSYWFSEDKFIKEDMEKTPEDLLNSLYPYIHGVNAGQGLKWGAVMRRLTHDETLLETTRNGVNWTFEYHGTPSGAIIGDERMSGLSPIRGTELCSVVESMFSLNYLYQALGERDYAEKSELAAYNALPVMLMPHWWAHQYVAQTNQPSSHKLNGETPFWNVGPMGQTFGTEPNYPCCTVNMQGYAKFVPAIFVKDSDDGLAHVLLGPAYVSTTLHKRNHVRIRCKTNYPFANYLDYEIKAERAFRFSFRVPKWANLTSSVIMLDSGKKHPLDPDETTGLHTIIVPPGRSRIQVSFSTSIQIHTRKDDTVSITHGALLYALSLPGRYTTSRPEHYPGTSAPPQANDWTITPTSPWNLAIDSSTLKFYEYENRYADWLPNPVWHEDRPPVSISALACPINWTMEEGGYVREVPKVGARNCTGRAIPIELRPYGSAKLHMAEMPTVDLRPGSPDLWQPDPNSAD